MEWLKLVRDLVSMAVGSFVLVWPVIVHETLSPELIGAAVLLLGWSGTKNLQEFQSGSRKRNGSRSRHSRTQQQRRPSPSTGRGTKLRHGK